MSVSRLDMQEAETFVPVGADEIVRRPTGCGNRLLEFFLVETCDTLDRLTFCQIVKVRDPVGNRFSTHRLNYSIGDRELSKARTEVRYDEYGYAAIQIAPDIGAKSPNGSVVLDASIANMPSKTISVVRSPISARNLQKMCFP